MINLHMYIVNKALAMQFESQEFKARVVAAASCLVIATSSHFKLQLWIQTGT